MNACFAPHGALRVLRAAGIGALLAASFTAQAQMIAGYPDRVEAYDSREVAMLPKFCLHTQDFRAKVPGGSDPTQIARGRAVMGDTYEHMHHYCWGLMKTNRAVLLARNEQARKFYLADAISEFDYVIAHAPQDFVLLPEILTKKGENLIRLGRGGTGVVELERAAELKPDYWPPYAFMSDYYKELGDAHKARELLEKGLENAPDAVGLKRRLSEHEGKGAKKP